MTVGTFNPGGTSAAQYRITQMYAAAYYFLTFFAPVHLTADSDWTVLPGIFDSRALVGLAFLLGVGGTVWFASRRNDGKPVAFGLIWFLAALFPTSWMPLAEVVNDHRMFFPFVGLSLAVVFSVWLAIRKWWHMPALRYAAAAALCLVLAAEARATWQRNEVWRSEETLWRDAVAKSPSNGRALMNYALTLMGRGASAEALVFLERAHQLIPNYAFLEINLGIAKSMLNRPREAEEHFRRAEALEPRRYESHFFYGRWLREQGRTLEALYHLRSAVEYNPYALDARHLYMQLLAEQRDWPALDVAIAGTLRIAPDDPESLRLRALPRTAQTHVNIAPGTAGQPTTADGWVDYALLLYQAGKFRECIEASRKALQLKPDYAAAWNNIAAAHNSLQEWDAGIRAADEALRLRPDFELARNNRDWAVAQRARP